MPPDAPISPAALVVGGLLVAGALGIWFEQIRHIVNHGDRVRTEPLGLPELLMSFVLAGFFGMLMISAIRHSAEKSTPAVTIDSVLPNSLIFVAFTIGIGAFLHYSRRMSLTGLFGIRRLSTLATIGWAGGLILTVFPLAGLANLITMQLLAGKADPQPLVELFSKVSRTQDFLGIAKIFIAGVIIAPCCEEFLFRGFFYGTWKRYLGGVPAGVIASVLFAAFHTNLFAFGGLLVLAICLNIAYERTGSLLVPIGMHALFNFTSLAVLYLQAQITPAS